MPSTDFPVFTKTFHSSLYASLARTSAALPAKGKVVLVTGGGRGIGKAIAMAFAKAGASAIVILGRNKVTLSSAETEITGLARAGGHLTVVRTFTADVTDTGAIFDVFKAVRDEFKRVDVVVSNAAGLHLATLEATNIDDYWKTFEINVKGTLNVIQAALKFGFDRNGSDPATFINVSSVGLIMPTFPTWSNYVATKLAAFSMTQYLAAESGGKIRAFSIHPGRVETDMAKENGIPTFEDPELPGAFCVWLAATREADFLQDRLVACNWDIDELLQMREEIEAKGLLKMHFAGLSM
ncbi:putative short-chain dehydrogenase [Paraphaeosphaeria sporulosa]|uniref:Putative short-chain dehydrogenase n=1 Tax=Paraphaeosphaeria sporulosa TaxID=1460663 RepID=A0A177C6T5_9PLEO|nr:putative short-chain dehydrogenase [Paraphaeosphaeria sporulosa]OAG02410.1 putative short-chain dehydrogenase [Paraphaeosphaeria sporulosa]